MLHETDVYVRVYIELFLSFRILIFLAVLKALSTFEADTLKYYYYYYFREYKTWISCETIYMKCQVLISLKNNLNIFQSVVCCVCDEHSKG